MTTLSMREILVRVEQDDSEAERLQVRLRAVETSEQEDAFWEFVGAVARHEFVAEVVVHPSVHRRHTADGDGAISACRAADDGALDDPHNGYHCWNVAHMHAHPFASRSRPRPAVGPAMASSTDKEDFPMVLAARDRGLGPWLEFGDIEDQLRVLQPVAVRKEVPAPMVPFYGLLAAEHGYAWTAWSATQVRCAWSSFGCPAPTAHAIRCRAARSWVNGSGRWRDPLTPGPGAGSRRTWPPGGFAHCP